jgi:predicted SAM-dependent methyltransferase
MVNHARTMRLFQKSGPEPISTGPRLHIGCGQEAIPGWVNIDSRQLPGVDRVLDIRQGLPFENVDAIYAEHFLEHLSLEDGLAFLRECRRVLTPQGILRLSTPNLDWVYATHYRLGQTTSDDDRVLDCLRLNRAFQGWGHQFLYNGSMLSAALRACGFATVAFHRYGQSGEKALRGLERHETWEDTEELPHVIIAEASGRARPEPLPPELLREFLEAIHTR